MKNNATHEEWIDFFRTIDTTKLAAAQHFLPKQEPAWYQAGLPHYKPKNCLAFMVGSLSSLLTSLSINLPHLNTTIDHQLKAKQKRHISNDINLKGLTLSSMIAHLKKDLEPILKLQSLSFFQLGKMAVKFSMGTLNMGLSSQSYVYLLLLSHYNTHPNHPFAFLDHKTDFLFFLNFLSNYLLRYHPKDLKNQNTTEITSTIKNESYQQLQQLLSLNEKAHSISYHQTSPETVFTELKETSSKESSFSLNSPPPPSTLILPIGSAQTHPETIESDPTAYFPSTSLSSKHSNSSRVKTTDTTHPHSRDRRKSTDFSLRSHFDRCKKKRYFPGAGNYPASHPLYNTLLSLTVLMPLVTLVHSTLVSNNTENNQNPINAFKQYGFQLFSTLAFTVICHRIAQAITSVQHQGSDLIGTPQIPALKRPLLMLCNHPHDTSSHLASNNSIKPPPSHALAVTRNDSEPPDLGVTSIEPPQKHVNQEEKKQDVTLAKHSLLHSTATGNTNKCEMETKTLTQWLRNYNDILNDLHQYTTGISWLKNYQEPVQKILIQHPQQLHNIPAPDLLQQYQQLHSKLKAILKPDSQGTIFNICSTLDSHIQHIQQHIQATHWPTLI